MSKDMENTSNQDNESWNDQNKKRVAREDVVGDYNSDGMSKQYFIPPPQQAHISIPKPQEYVDSNLGGQQQSMTMSKSAVPEDAEVSDAMVFLNKIKEEYSNEMLIYDNFLETMRDFKFGKN
ncbi:transcriptional regulator-like protein [Nosema bombycis CQ1]|uniref:Transcriptional regulator-like protein n=1 Tax=Nosema bombycis (strain CQ1 / CVCC 102059) TaxID=578461 RepID=R0M8C3_NOSB1|nr:transcriptional regulator-like protein [Nosema bombycis CQ1]|eukprot:EOB14234.1 transcriptional regulator-like protein [Nosema bombycis CQ1]